MVQFLSLKQAIAENLKDGDAVAFEGFTHLIPHAAAHEAIRQGRKNLTLIRMTPDIIYDQMVGMNCVKKLIYAYVGNPGVGLLRRVSDAVKEEWPAPLELEEYSHAGMASAYEAGAAGLPCAIYRGYTETGLKHVNPNYKFIDCPFTGETLTAIPSINPDVGIIHAQRANKKGDVLVQGITGVQKETALASKKVVVTVDEIVDDFDNVDHNACVLPSWILTAIAHVPGGSHPSYSHGVYNRDNNFYLEWDKISSDRETFLAWMEANVMNVGPEVFAERVEKLRGSRHE